MSNKNNNLGQFEPSKPSRIGSDIFQLFVWLWAEGRSVNEMVTDLGFSSKTVRDLLRRIRSSIEIAAPEYSTRLDGVVYVDTWTYRPRETSKTPKRPTLLGIMSAEGELRLLVIPGINQGVIHGLVKAHVTRGATLITNQSKMYSALKIDGFPLLKQVSQANLKQRARSREPELNLHTIWDRITEEMNRARGVRENNFIPRVREFELRWRFRRLPKICLYQHVISLRPSKS